MHGARCVRHWFRTAEPLEECRYENWNALDLTRLYIEEFVLTHWILVNSSTVACWISPLVILGVSGLVCCFHSIFGGKSC